MEIRYKVIKSERTEDAPFVGALISAIDCTFKCEGCFNQYLKEYPTLVKDAKDIIKEIKKNKFNKGIIFGGLEWSLQPTELYNLAKVASKNGLQIMVYTGCTEQCFDSRVDISTLGAFINNDFYIKFGGYDSHNVASKKEFGVTLVTDNQYIVKFRKDGSKIIE